MSIETLKTESAGVAWGLNIFAIGCTFCPDTKTPVAKKRPASLEEQSIVEPCPALYELRKNVFVGRVNGFCVQPLQIRN
jgi:hypothetical protein